MLFSQDGLCITEGTHRKNFSFQIGGRTDLRPHDQSEERTGVQSSDKFSAQSLHRAVENRRNIQGKIDMAIRQRDGCDVAVHLYELRFDSFGPKKALLEGDLHRKPGHAHSGIGKRDLSRFGTVRQIAMPEDEEDYCCDEESVAHLWFAAFGKKRLLRRREAHEALEKFYGRGMLRCYSVR